MWEIRSESISLERLDGETILINFDSGEYFSFVGPAADVLWLVDSGIERSAWAGILEVGFPGLSVDDEVNAGIDAFVGELQTAGIIRVVDGDGVSVGELPADYVRGEWTTPKVNANDDLADLLLIDPIHDADEEGWPEKRPDPA